jgi:hypothetical protein
MTNHGGELEGEATLGAAQARALFAQAASDGLRFEGYLPPPLATWILKKIAERVFPSPEAAILAIVSDHVQLDRLERLRQLMMERSLARSNGRPVPVQTLEDVAQEVVDEADRAGVPAYWHRNRNTAQLVDRVDESFIVEMMPRFSTYSEAASWYLSWPLAGFGGSTAADLVRAGRAQDVRDYFEAAAAGVFA